MMIRFLAALICACLLCAYSKDIIQSPFSSFNSKDNPNQSARGYINETNETIEYRINEDWNQNQANSAQTKSATKARTQTDLANKSNKDSQSKIARANDNQSKNIDPANRGLYEYKEQEERPWEKIMTRIFNYQKQHDRKPLCDISWQRKICDGSYMCYATKCFYYDIDERNFYEAMLNSKLESLSEDTNKNHRSILQLRKLIEIGLPKDNAQYNINFKETSGEICKYTIARKDSNRIDIDLTGCNQDQKILITLIKSEYKTNEGSNKQGIIEIYKHIRI